MFSLSNGANIWNSAVGSFWYFPNKFPNSMKAIEISAFFKSVVLLLINTWNLKKKKLCDWEAVPKKEEPRNNWNDHKLSDWKLISIPFRDFCYFSMFKLLHSLSPYRRMTTAVRQRETQGAHWWEYFVCKINTFCFH